MMFAIEFPNIWWNNWPLPMWSSSNLVVFKKGLDVPGLNVLLYCEHNNITFLRLTTVEIHFLATISEFHLIAIPSNLHES